MQVRGDVRVYPNLQSVCRLAAVRAVALVRETVKRNNRCSIALAGGSTPRTLYELLAQDLASKIPWRQVDVFWGDERFVPLDDPQSNYGMARDSLLRHVPIPAEGVHPMDTSHTGAEDAAEAYERTLREHFQDTLPRFDLMILGIGEDGHTASLFPGSSAVKEKDRWVVAVDAPADPPQRLTLTFPVINAAREVFVIAAGSAKAEAVRCALHPVPNIDACPASGIRPESGKLSWWLDEDAAALLGMI